MTDLSGFSNDSFKSSSWINAAIKERPEEETLESYLASLAMKLHIVSQDYTDQLETGMVEAMTSIPRVMSDVSRIEEVLKLVDIEMSELANQLRAFDQRNVAGVEDLSRLDTVKTNMENCKSTLEEHARWSQLVREAKNLLESGEKLMDTADRIETMFRSLDILKHLPGHEERMQTCDTFRDSLLIAIRPKVRIEILAIDLTSMHDFLLIYSRLNRTNELEEEYSSCRPDRLRAVFDMTFPSITIPVTTTTTTTSLLKPIQQPLDHNLMIFLGKVDSFLTDESHRIQSLFGKERVSDLLCAMITKITTPLAAHISAALSGTDSPEIISVSYNIMEEFYQKMAPLLEDAAMDVRLKAVRTTYAGFESCLDTYASSEGRFIRASLDQCLQPVSFTAGYASDYDYNNGDAITTFSSQVPSAPYMYFADKLLTASTDFLPLLEASVYRSCGYLGGLRVKTVLRSLTMSMSQFTKQLLAKIEELRASMGLTPIDSTPISNSSSSTVVSRASASPGVASTVYLSDGTRSNLSSTVESTTSTVTSIPINTPNKIEPSLSLDSNLVARKLAQSLAELGAASGRLLLPCSLRTVQSVGRLCGSIAALEAYASEELGEVYSNLFLDVGTGVSSTMTSGGNLAAIDILQADSSSSSELKGFLASLSRSSGSGSGPGSASNAHSVFAAVTPSLIRLKASAGLMLFDQIVTGPTTALNDLYLDTIWSAGDPTTLPISDGNGQEFSSIYDNILPQASVTHVGEHLLSLVQEFELFASSDALEDLLQLTGEAQSHVVRGWRPLKSILETKDFEGIDGLCRRKYCLTVVEAADKSIFGVSLNKSNQLPGAEQEGREGVAIDSSEAIGQGDGGVAEEEMDAVMRFVNEWLGAVADYVVGVLLQQLAQIKTLSPTGRAQLLVDLDYLSTVVSALGLAPHPVLMHLSRILRYDPSTVSPLIDLLPLKSATAIALHKLDLVFTAAIVKGHPLMSVPAVAAEVLVVDDPDSATSN